MYDISETFYAAYLREKRGELQAVRLLDSASARCLLPIFVALPLNERENRDLDLNDLVKREVGRVLANWADRPCLWDPRFLVFDEMAAEEDANRLRQILGQFLRFGAKVIPVVGLRQSYHRAAVLSEHARRSRGGVAIRIEFDDVTRLDLLSSQLEAMRMPSSECILIVDISSADISEHDEFAKSLISWLFALQEAGPWARIIVTSTTYPIKNPALENGHFEAQRLEWKLWDWTLRAEPSLKDFVIFGDFGADNAKFNFDGGGRPIPHLRYLLRELWMVVRGTEQYASLREVAKRIVSSSYFSGRSFSAGDEFIFDCAAGVVGTGDPTQWRAVNMNHHLTQTIRTLADRYGVELAPRQPSNAEQLVLL